MTSRPAAFLLLSLASLSGCIGSSILDAHDGAAPDVQATDLGAETAPSDVEDSAVDDLVDASDVAAMSDAVDAADAFDASATDTGIDTGYVKEDITFIPPDVQYDVPMDLPRDRPILDVPFGTPVLTRPGRSGAVAITPDDRIVVTANRAMHSVSVFALATGLAPTVVRLAEVSTGANSEPWQVVVSPDGDSAYVLLRRSQQVARVVQLHSAPALATSRVNTGSEPVSMALSPTGRTLYVANFADGTVSAINTVTMTQGTVYDLNAPLATAGYLGAGVAGRRGMAHPRAIVVTNDGDADDTDETLYITEFFGQRRLTAGPTGLERFDQERVGVVYRIPQSSQTVELRTLSPVTDITFRDGNGAVSGCFPNQLYAAAIAQNRVFITSVCASPRGPTGPVAPPVTDAGTPLDVPRDVATDVRPDIVDVVTDAPDTGPPIPPLDPVGANFRTEQTGMIFVLDHTMDGNEVTALRVNLNQRMQALYDARRTPDDPSRRFPLIPIDLDFVPVAGAGTSTSTVAYLAAYGSDALYRVRFNTTGTFAEVSGTNLPSFVDLGASSFSGTALTPGSGPYGVATTSLVLTHAVAVNEFSRTLSAVDLNTQLVTSVAPLSMTTPATSEASALRGRKFFVTGLGRWSFKGQGWNSCETCHPDGLTDNVTWFFARGPRQTIPLDSTLDPSGLPRLMNWTAIFDEVADFELNTRGNSGGVGAVVHRRNDGAATPSVTNADRIVFDGTSPVAPQVATTELHDGLNGAIGTIASTAGTSTVRSVLDDWADIQAYTATIRTPRAPTGLSMADGTAGRALFTTHGCAGCHGGPNWTVSRRFYTPSTAVNDRTTGTLVRQTWTRPANFPATVIATASGAFRLTPFDAANDQITCALRNVGTWATGRGVAPTGVDLLEVRANMTTVSQGQTGFNPPSLLGVALGAPYLHAGNARSLEELFTDTFAAHHRAYSPNFLAASNPNRANELRQIIAFLLSIDELAAAITLPTRVTPPDAGAFDSDPCAQYR
jgi:hypothetical protein